jgi:hypothetical protein
MRKGCKYYQFTKELHQDLHVLSPPVKGFEVDNFRIKIVRSKLHGHIAPEACFVEEGLRTASLRKFLPDDQRHISLEVQVPSPTNLLLLKLFAFNDRDEGKRQDSERAQAHVWDVYVTIMLTDRDDYLEGQQFLSHHEGSEIILTARSIVAGKFNQVDHAGWRRVLESSDFYPALNRPEKEARLDEARRRLISSLIQKIIRGLIAKSCRDADGGHADCTFFGAVDADNCVYVVVVQSTDFAGAEVQAHGR